jgi:hypothetical protein
LFSGCRSETNDDPGLAIDYRTKYTGVYQFFSYHWYSSLGKYTTSDSIYFTGKITLVENSDSMIQILYRPGSQFGFCNGDSVFGAHIEPMVNVTGILKHERLKWCSNHSSFNGWFTNTDSVYFSHGTGSLGVQYGQIIRGVKLKN